MKESNLPTKKKFNIRDKIRKYISNRRHSKFYKHLHRDTPEDRAKALKVWEMLSDEEKIRIIMSYNEEAFFKGHTIRLGFENTGEFPIYSTEFINQILDDLWKNSNSNVQKNTYFNQQSFPLLEGRKFNANREMVERNWKFTHPDVQKEIFGKLIEPDWASADIVLTHIITWLHATGAPKDMEMYLFEFKMNWFFNQMEGFHPEALPDAYDGIMQYLNKINMGSKDGWRGGSDETEILKRFVQQMPEDIKAAKIDTTFDYSVREDALFSQNWNKLSYSDKMGVIRDIFSRSIFEYHEEDNQEMEDTNLIRRLYPDCYNRFKNGRKSFVGTSVIAYDPRVITRMIRDMRGDDLDKHLCAIINQHKANPLTVMHIWKSLDRSVQIRYYDQVMAILDKHPISQYQLWEGINVNSDNQYKQALPVFDAIQSVEDVISARGSMEFIQKRGSRYKSPREKDVPNVSHKSGDKFDMII